MDTTKKLNLSPRPGAWCCVPQCKRHSKMENIKMLRFPRDIKQRTIWTVRIRRENWVPKFTSRICSWHFPTGDRRKGPTRFDWNLKKAFSLNYPEPNTLKKAPTEPLINTDPVATLSDSAVIGGCTDCMQLRGEIEALQCELQMQKNANRQLLEALDAETTQRYANEDCITKLESAVQELRLKLKIQDEEGKTVYELLSQQNEVLKNSTIRYHYLKDDKRFSKFTGMTIGTFDALCEILQSKVLTYEFGWSVETVPFEDQVLIFLMKMRMNLTFDFISKLYFKNRKTITNIFYTFLYSFYNVFYVGTMSDIPSLDKVQSNFPDSFKEFPNCRIIIDCTEFHIEPSKQLSHKCATYSNYKSRNTFKNLIGVAPNGTIVYVGESFGGSTSDKAIVIHSHFMKTLNIGDMVMADKGFLLHDIMPEGVSLVTPDYLVNQQFTANQVSRNKKISSARVNVERGIQRMRVFKIVSLLPRYLRPHSSVVLRVVGFLANCMPPLMQESIGRKKKPKTTKKTQFID